MTCCGSKQRSTEVEHDVLSFGVERISNPRGEYELVLKMVIVGDSGVGKSAMLIRLVEGSFAEGLNSTIGVDFKTYMLEVNDHQFKVIMWDTAGQERFEAITSSYYRGMHAVLLVYDMTNPESYARLPHWLAKAQSKGSKFDVIVVGCKKDAVSDRKPAVDTSNLEELIGKHQHVTVSSKLGTGFKKLTQCLARTALEELRHKLDESRRSTVNT